MHGGEFNGNLKRHLEALLENAKVGFESGKIFAVLKIFNANSIQFNSSYRDSILSFEREYKGSRISITSKVHAILKQLPELIENQAEKHVITKQKLPPTL